MARRSLGGLAAAALSLFSVSALAQPIQTPLAGTDIPKFQDALPTFVGARVGGPAVGVSMKETKQQVLPAGLPATTVWGYEVAGLDASGKPVVRAARFPGVSVEARQSVPTTVLYTNDLRTPRLQSILPVDQTINWADPRNAACQQQSPMSAACYEQYAGPVPAVVHLHGGEVPPAFDGGPDAWFTATGKHGGNYSSLVSVLPNQALYRYPNTQEATAIWFHDHALGTTRLNVYGGIAAFYLLRDEHDTGKANNPLRLPAGDQEVEIALQDRSFAQDGDFLYFDASQLSAPDLHPFWRPEFFGDAIVVNGKTWPVWDVEPRRYRVRLLDGSNARFYNLAFRNESGGKLPGFWQIGTDGGRLEKPVALGSLLIAPGERADLILDFSGLAGQTFTVTNDANAPYPDGDPVDPATTGQIMRIRVSKPLSAKDQTCNPATNCNLRPDESLVRLVNPSTGELARGVTPAVKRQLILKEIAVDSGPREVLVNNTLYSGVKESTLKNGGVPLRDADGLGENWATEAPRVGSTEVWEVANLTVDAHPIHLHLVQFQVLNRQDMDTGEDEVTGEPLGYMKLWQASFPNGVFAEGDGPPHRYGRPNADGAIGGNPAFSPFLVGAPTPAAANEAGWKDTVVMLPGTVTRLAVRWAPQAASLARARPGLNLYAFDPSLTDRRERDVFGNPGAAGYVWHCHILEHEDNEMMRPYAVAR
jgi:FtsP/CotA-like multicopper oxidase with cupredoxin domain